MKIEEELKSDDPDIVESAIEKANELRHRQTGTEGEMILLKESVMGYGQHEPITFRPSKKSPPKTFQI